MCALLVDLGYLDRDGEDLEVTENGRWLARLYAEKDLVLAESGGPELSLFVPPPLWASDAFTGGAEAVSGSGEFESTALFPCDPDDVRWGTEDEGTMLDLPVRRILLSHGKHVVTGGGRAEC